jgi:hypothetical protein
VAKAERHLLAHRDHIAGHGAGAFEHGQVLAAFSHRLFEFEGDVEMFDNPGLAAPGNEDHLFDPRLARFVHRILDQRAVDHGEQFLGHHLGRRQEPRAKPGDREYGLTDRLGRHQRILTGLSCA